MRVRRAVVGAQRRWRRGRRRRPATALEHDLVDGDVAVVSGPPARALARDAEANLRGAGGEGHVRLLPVVVARPAQASRALRDVERPPARDGAGEPNAREPIAW